MTLKILPVTIERHPVFYALSQEYEAEFAAITKKLPDEKGQYAYTDQVKEKYEAWLAYQEETPLGFAVVDVSRTSYDIAEFYVVPSFRREGYGEQFAQWIFKRYRGPWQVRQIRGAEYARSFWTRVISNFSKALFYEGIEQDPEWGQVYIQKFNSNDL